MNQIHLCIFCLIFIFSYFIHIATAQQLNNRPVIGILSVPSPFQIHDSISDWSYIPASYVKFIEAAGARVIPIPYDASPDNITFLFNGTNGLLLIGGETVIGLMNTNTDIASANLVKSAKLLYELAIKANKNGIYYPIWCTCQGFQLLSKIVSKNYELLDVVQGEKFVNRNILFTYNAHESKLWGSAPNQIIHWLTHKSVANFDHNYAISIEYFYRNKHYYHFAKLLAVAYASFGRSFIASIESKYYPIYGNQFHPEKNAFEWKLIANAPHTYQAIVFSQYCANFFVQETRKNNQSFPDTQALNQSLIYNWNVIIVKSTFMGPAYIFPTVSSNPQAWPALFTNYEEEEENEEEKEEE